MICSFIKYHEHQVRKRVPLNFPSAFQHRAHAIKCHHPGGGGGREEGLQLEEMKANVVTLTRRSTGQISRESSLVVIYQTPVSTNDFFKICFRRKFHGMALSRKQMPFATNNQVSLKAEDWKQVPYRWHLSPVGCGRLWTTPPFMGDCGGWLE